jgi:hypothetical protein
MGIAEITTTGGEKPRARALPLYVAVTGRVRSDFLRAGCREAGSETDDRRAPVPEGAAQKADDMPGEQSPGDAAASSDGPGEADAGRPRISRRQAMGRMSAVATAGAAAWVVPEILMAKPAAGAGLSSQPGTGGGSTGVSTSPVTTGGTSTGSTNGAEGVPTAATGPANSLAFTGLDIQRDAEIGAALIAGGWAMRRWASRTPKPAVEGSTGAHQPGSTGDLT